MNPRHTFSFVSAAFLALAVIGLVFKFDPAIAQQATEAVEEITVKAPVVHRNFERGPAVNRVGTEIIEVRARVSYADLDLSKYADVTELKTRIETIAKDSCEKLSDMFPMDKKMREIRRCANESVADTEEQVQAAIAAAS